MQVVEDLETLGLWLDPKMPNMRVVFGSESHDWVTTQGEWGWMIDISSSPGKLVMLAVDNIVLQARGTCLRLSLE